MSSPIPVESSEESSFLDQAEEVFRNGCQYLSDFVKERPLCASVTAVAFSILGVASGAYLVAFFPSSIVASSIYFSSLVLNAVILSATISIAINSTQQTSESRG